MAGERSMSSRTVAARAGTRVRLAMRPAWADRFRQPNAEQLLAGVIPALRPLLSAMRDRLRGHPQARESLAWLGTWQWTLQFRTAATNGVAWVYLIPNPQRPQVCIPVQDAFLAGVAPRLLTRSMLETLSLAPTVDGVRWATWDVQSRTQMDGLATLAIAIAGPEQKTRQEA